MELKICISPQFRAIDPPNPARGFIQQNENVRFATAACMQKYGNVSFATVACAKCMRYGGRGGDPYHGGGGGGWQHGTRNHIYIYTPKTKMTMENPPLEDVFPIKKGAIFQCHVSFRFSGGDFKFVVAIQNCFLTCPTSHR